MNLNSKILKLSIIFMLILVLIPAATAMDSEESFYQEYEVQEDEGFVEEYNSYEVEYTPEDVSLQSDYDDEVHYDGPDITYQDQPREEDAVEIAELNLDSVEATPDIINNQNIDEIGFDLNAQDFDDIQENSDDELTYDTNSVNYQGSIFISKYDTTFNYNLINQILYTGMTTTFKTTSLNRGELKVLELKNNLLIKHDIQTTDLDDENDDLEDIIVCINNTGTDFAYSIDNSIVGDECRIFISNTCFLKCYTCFDAIFCCKLLDVEFFSRGDFLNCFGLFVGILQLNTVSNLSLMIAQPNSG